jgi:hypothetical protein
LIVLSKGFGEREEVNERITMERSDYKTLNFNIIHLKVGVYFEVKVEAGSGGYLCDCYLFTLSIQSEDSRRMRIMHTGIKRVHN